MTESQLRPAIRDFIDFFAGLGPRWGLDGEACRVHAYLYIVGEAMDEATLGAELNLPAERLDAALAVLADLGVAARDGHGTWSVGEDPWEMLFSGLEARRRRELEPARTALSAAYDAALGDETLTTDTRQRIGQVVQLVEDLAAIDMRIQRLSPHLIRRAVGLTGHAARFMDRVFGQGRRAAS